MVSVRNLSGSLSRLSLSGRPAPAASRVEQDGLGSVWEMPAISAPECPSPSNPSVRLARPGGAVLVVGIDIYGLVSDHTCFTRLAAALCHPLPSGITATHHSVALLGAVPQASFWQPRAHFRLPEGVLGLSLHPFSSSPPPTSPAQFAKTERCWHLRKSIWDLPSD